MLPGASAGSFALRAISTSSAALADLTVEVPSMGESISEGTVAQILVQPGRMMQRRGVGGGTWEFFWEWAGEFFCCEWKSGNCGSLNVHIFIN